MVENESVNSVGKPQEFEISRYSQSTHTSESDLVHDFPQSGVIFSAGPALLTPNQAKRMERWKREIEKAFGHTEAEQLENFRQRFYELKSLRELGSRLSEEGIDLSQTDLKKIKRKLDEVTPRPKKKRQPKREGHVKKKDRNLVREAERKGWIFLLTSSDRDILQMRHPKKKNKKRIPKSLEEVGEKLNKSKQRVKQIEQRALYKLRKIKAGESIKTSGGQRKEVDTDALIKEYEAVHSLAKAGKPFGASRFVVRDRLVSIGYPIKPSRGRKK